MHACRYDAYIYDAAEILSSTDGRTYEPTDKAILGVGNINIEFRWKREVNSCETNENSSR